MVRYEMRIRGKAGQATHMPATAHKRDWMEFVSGFVADFGKELVDLVHSYGKKSLVFYDDSQTSLETEAARLFRKAGLL